MGKYYKNRIVLEFNETKAEEMETYNKLLKFSHPASIVKDILTRALPVEIIDGNLSTNKSQDTKPTNNDEPDDDIFVNI